MLKLDKRDFIGKILFLLFAIAWGYGEHIHNVNDDFKYVFAILNISLIAASFIIKRKKLKEMFFYDELKKIFIVGLFSIIFSIILQLINGKFIFYAYKDFFYMIFPIVYVFFIWNDNKKMDVDFYFNALFIVFVVCFFGKFKDIFNMKNIAALSFSSSYSAFESPYSTIFLQMFIYYYIREKRIPYILAAFFCVLSLKRLDMLFLIAFPIIYKLCKGEVTSNKRIFMLKIFFICSPYIIRTIYSDTFANLLYNNMNINLNELTTGRVRLMNYIVNNNVKSMGLGTIEVFLNNLTGETNLHCDMYKFYFETSIIGVVLLVNNYFNIVKKNKIMTWVMTYLFVTMLLSQCITSVMVWLMFYLTIGYYKKNILEEVKNVEK